MKKFVDNDNGRDPELAHPGRSANRKKPLEEKKAEKPNFLDSALPIPFKPQNADKRRPKQQDQPEDRFFRLEPSLVKNGDPKEMMDPRDRILKELHGKGKGVAMRPQSNQLDRFGRILRDKNRELSQASLDVPKDQEGSGSFPMPQNFNKPE